MAIKHTAALAAIDYLKKMVAMHDEWNEKNPELAAAEERFGYARGMHSAIKAIEDEVWIADNVTSIIPSSTGFFNVTTREDESFPAFYSHSGWRFLDGHPVSALIEGYEPLSLSPLSKVNALRTIRLSLAH